MKKTVLGATIAAGITVIGVSILATKPTALAVDNKIANATVMITNMRGNSGGTGVVVEADRRGSLIITNAHVCSLLSNGGKVVDSDGNSSLPTEYALSEEHDLCAIKISEELKNIASVGKKEPQRFESSIISGHPSLLPITVTNGHFGDKTIIEVLTKIEKCKDKDYETEIGALICIFFGGNPVITSYQSQFVTATIMAGSSGSGVYNSKGELVGIAFAGSGEIGYAHTVPFTYLDSFLTIAMYNRDSLNWKAPNYSNRLSDLLSSSRKKSETESLAKKCEQDDKKHKEITKICEIITDTVK